MQRKSGRGGAGHDVEAALDELYATAPSDFVARREVLAAAARTGGHVEDARRIHAARRPTLAAWAANLLLRSQPDESRRFLELGQALRDAYQTLDADGVKELSEQRRSVVSALSRQTAQLARNAGHRLSDTAQQDVEATLRAVLADQDAADQWATGRLTSALVPPSTFPTATPAAAGPPSRPPKPSQRSQGKAAQPSARPKAKDELADRRRRRQEELTRARKAAKAAEQHLRHQRTAESDADAQLKRARDRQVQARRQVAAAEQQLQQASETLQQAEQEQQEAEERRQAAADALARAERQAREAAQEVDSLDAPGT
ncbi:hypothetical protein [Streptomyces sp. AC555_RSS877]|uniref:hypothetical protein n=1 Tax=Streptomyces sp. AC555_RSS877 TaxID=2823688 RepID=UPI001C276B16|nr:hypothetical protein [Streptomyces sp. AC555_RSS877]